MHRYCCHFCNECDSWNVGYQASNNDMAKFNLVRVAKERWGVGEQVYGLGWSWREDQICEG